MPPNIEHICIRFTHRESLLSILGQKKTATALFEQSQSFLSVFFSSRSCQSGGFQIPRLSGGHTAINRYGRTSPLLSAPFLPNLLRPNLLRPEIHIHCNTQGFPLHRWSSSRRRKPISTGLQVQQAKGRDRKFRPLPLLGGVSSIMVCQCCNRLFIAPPYQQIA